jgi:uncharacterized protein (DUF58 family)
VSASGNFGTISQTKRELVTMIAATIAFSAIQNNDKIGVIFFSDQIEKFIPPQKGKKHVLYIIREMLGIEPQSTKTNIEGALQYMTNAIKKRSTAFIISDFIDKDFSKSLLIANRKHDMVGLQVYDKREAELPSVGLIKVKDAESGEDMWIDTSDKKLRMAYGQNWKEKQERLKQTFNQCGVNYESIATDEDFVKALMNLFRRRA